MANPSVRPRIRPRRRPASPVPATRSACCRGGVQVVVVVLLLLLLLPVLYMVLISVTAGLRRGRRQALAEPAACSRNYVERLVDGRSGPGTDRTA